MAMPQASRLSPSSSVMGSVNRPNVVRMPLVTAAMRQPAMTRTISGTAAERAGAAAATVVMASNYSRFGAVRNEKL